MPKITTMKPKTTRNEKTGTLRRAIRMMKARKRCPVSVSSSAASTIMSHVMSPIPAMTTSRATLCSTMSARSGSRRSAPIPRHGGAPSQMKPIRSRALSRLRRQPPRDLPAAAPDSAHERDDGDAEAREDDDRMGRWKGPLDGDGIHARIEREAGGEGDGEHRGVGQGRAQEPYGCADPDEKEDDEDRVAGADGEDHEKRRDDGDRRARRHEPVVQMSILLSTSHADVPLVPWRSWPAAPSCYQGSLVVSPNPSGAGRAG